MKHRQLGNYVLLKLIGRGGLANVYLGEHILLGNRVAIKVLRPGLTNTQAFIEEARIAVHLHHPNIIRVLEFAIEDDTPFMVMDYASHGSIHDYFPSNSRLSFELILDYVEQVAGAVQYIHDRGYIHRDIKSENLLLGPDMEVWLSDFGITMSAHTDVPTNTRWGTLSHMAPELLYPTPQPCFANDQYALAVVVYEWLSGTLPFTGTRDEIIHQQLFSAPKSLCKLAHDIPKPVESVLFKALAKEPYERFESVQIFADELYDALHQHATPIKDNDPLATAVQVITSGNLMKPHGTATMIAPTPTLLEPEQIQQVEQRKPRKSHSTLWREITNSLALDVLVGIAVACLLTILSITPIVSLWLIILSLILVPLVSAWRYKNRSLLFLTCSMIGIAAALAVLAHSLIIFIAPYVCLLLLTLLIAFAVSIGNFER